MDEQDVTRVEVLQVKAILLFPRAFWLVLQGLPAAVRLSWSSDQQLISFFVPVLSAIR
jgi:hypothetical protein